MLLAECRAVVNMTEQNCEPQHISHGLSILKTQDPCRPYPVARKEYSGMSKSDCDKLAHECSLLKLLNHPCICHFLSDHCYLDESDGLYHFVIEMTFFETSLWEELETRRGDGEQQFSELEVQRMMWDIASALAYAQSRRVTHRDVKPANIMRSPGTRYNLIDFGEGKVMQAAKDVASTIVGTIPYASPELRQKLVERRYQGWPRTSEYDSFVSDVYSLAVTALEMLDLSFKPESSRCDSSVLSRLQLSPEMQVILALMLENDPKKRPNCLKLKKILQKQFSSMYEADITVRLKELNSPNVSLSRMRTLLAELFALPVDICVGKCIKCGSHFSYSSQEDWRLEAFNTHQMSTSNLCSYDCYHQLMNIRGSVNQTDCARCNRTNLGLNWCYFHCKVHKCCERCLSKRTGRFFDNWKICPKCKYQHIKSAPFRQGTVAITYVNFEEFLFICAERGEISTKNAEGSAMLPSAIWPQSDSKWCHRCGVQVHPLQLWFLLICDRDVNYLCSYECLVDYFPDEITLKRTCPVCSKLIRNSQTAIPGDISSWLGTSATDCHMCLQASKEVLLPCGHHYCEGCIRNCREKYGEWAWHCVRCGCHIEEGAIVRLERGE